MVKGLSAILGFLGRVVDADDRRALGTAAILLVALIAVSVALAFAAGLGVRVFEWSSGI